jgi:hypothetical protein
MMIVPNSFNNKNEWRTVKATKLITLATLAVLALNVSAKGFSFEELQRRMLERRAVEAVIWGMPIVSLDAMRQVSLCT